MNPAVAPWIVLCTQLSASPATGELRLSTKSFDDIELTTYSPDVKGEITCGPRKPENVVIICYFPTADKRVKSDGILKSIEFVPADFKLKL